MACTHSAAMAVLNRLGGAAGDGTVAAMASAAGRLLRTYATQVEALRRLRNGAGAQPGSLAYVAADRLMRSNAETLTPAHKRGLEAERGWFPVADLINAQSH
jgi:hypothetical protein